MPILENSVHEKFAQLVASGVSYTEAYRETHDTTDISNNALWVRSSELAAKVLVRINELKTELADRALWTREQSVKSLVEVVDKPENQAAKISAIKELNIMHGYNAPQKIDVSGSVAIVVNFVGNDDAAD